MSEPRSLEIGGGTHPRAHHLFEQFDKHPWDELMSYQKFHRGDASDLSRFKDGTFDEVYSCQTLEHFGRRETGAVLLEWFRVLKVGGTLSLELPDILGMYLDYVQGRNTWDEFIERVFGSQDYEGNTHYTMFTREEFPGFIDRLFGKQAQITDLVSFANNGGFKIKLLKMY